MSRIVIDARELRTSSGRYVERLLFYLQKLDSQDEYEVLLKPKDFDNWKPSNSLFEGIKSDHKEFTFDEQTSFLDQIKSLKPDLVHFTFPQQPIRYKGTTVTTIHDLTTLRFYNPSKNKLVFTIKQRIYKYVIKKSVHKSKLVMTPSEFVKQDLVHVSGIDPEKIIVTYEAADPINETAEKISALEGKQFLLYVGRPTPHKNLTRLIEAFELLKDKYPELYLVLGGKKDDNYLRIEKIIQTKKLENIIFTDFISEGQLRWLYEHCAAYVFPSLSEGFGLPGLEAMVHGAPVISSNATCLPEIYGDAAEYFDPLDVQSISSAIVNVLSNEDRLKELIAKGYEHAKLYSWQHMAEQTLEVYKRALEE